MAVEIPPELVDTVLDHLFDDKPSLSAASVVSSAWLPASRYHLFRSIVFRLKIDTHFEDFFHFLCSSNLGVLVRDLTMAGLETCQPKQDRLSHPLLLQIFDHLPNLRSFHLLDVAFSRDPSNWSSVDSQRIKRGPAPVSLDQLTLESLGRYSEFGPETSAWEIFGICSLIQHTRIIHLSGLNFRIGSCPWAKTELNCAIRPTLLRIDNCAAMRILVKNLSRHNLFETIQELHIVSEDYSVVGQILREVGPYLRRLDLDLGNLGPLRWHCKRLFYYTILSPH